MEPIGFILLGIVGFFALKAFGNAPSAANGVLGLDPNTGAKLFNSRNFSTITQTIAQAPRIPATPLPSGQQYCPYPFKLYKDQADGKFYCYNETQLPTSIVASSSTLTQGSAQPEAGMDIFAGGSTGRDALSASMPEAGMDIFGNGSTGSPTYATTNMATPDTLTPPSDYIQAGSLQDVPVIPDGGQFFV